MMVTALDLFSIKERIRDILQNDTTDLYSATPSDKTKFRKIEAGSPKLVNGKIPSPFPALYVTHDNPINDMEPPWNVSANVGNTFENNVNFLLIYIADGKHGQKVEETLDDFTKLITETLQENYDLRNPSDGTDPKVARSWVGQWAELNSQLIGESVQGRVLRFRTIAYTS